jgi:hypothetical protein
VPAVAVASAVPTGRNLRSLQRQRSRHSIERRSLRTARAKWRVKLYATGLHRPGVLTVKIELMSACGHFSEVATLTLDVRCWGQIGSRFSGQSGQLFEPNETS